MAKLIFNLFNLNIHLIKVKEDYKNEIGTNIESFLQNGIDLIRDGFLLFLISSVF